MPSYVITSKCDGCKALDRTACQYICPNDLMTLDRQQMKAYNREPPMCWECCCCVKMCPTQAIEIRGYADFVPLGASVTALRTTEDILWTVQFRNPDIKPKRFRFPTRRGVSEGQVKPFDHFVTATDDLKSPMLMGEPAALDTKQGPVKHTGLPELALTRPSTGRSQ
jgi:adenylylsulfate reductase subunit B